MNNQNVPNLIRSSRYYNEFHGVNMSVALKLNNNI